MQVQLLFFARLREVFGASRVTLDVSDVDTVGHLARRLADHKPEIASVPLRFAVNDEFVDENRPLRDGDTIAVVHPVSGG